MRHQVLLVCFCTVLLVSLVVGQGTQVFNDFESIKDALDSGASSSYNIDLRRCVSSVQEFSPDVLGGPIEEYSFVPAGAFGPIGYLRMLTNSVHVTGEYRTVRLTTLHIYENKDVQLFLDEKTLGDTAPSTPIVFDCSLDSGPEGASVMILRRSGHSRQLHDVTDVGAALMAGRKVRMRVDLRLCDRHEPGYDIIFEGGTIIRDHDMTVTENEGRLLGFTTGAVSDSIPNCTPGNLMSGATGILRENANNMTLHQWGITLSDFGTCFQNAFDCKVSSPSKTEGSTFFIV